MVMAVEETVECTKEVRFFLEWCFARGKTGGLTAADRSALAERFGVSEDLLLRYERAQSIYKSVIVDKLLPQARVEAMRWLKQLGKEPMGPEFGEEMRQAFHRLEAAMSDNEIVCEFREVQAAIMAAIEASALTSEK